MSQGCAEVAAGQQRSTEPKIHGPKQGFWKFDGFICHGAKPPRSLYPKNSSDFSLLDDITTNIFVARFSPLYFPVNYPRSNHTQLQPQASIPPRWPSTPLTLVTGGQATHRATRQRPGLQPAPLLHLHRLLNPQLCVCRRERPPRPNHSVILTDGSPLRKALVH